MRRIEDDWHKPRSKQQHLTADEMAQVKASFEAGRTAVDTARDLKCSSSIIYGHFKRLREGPTAIKVMRFRPDRSYRSNCKQTT